MFQSHNNVKWTLFSGSIYSYQLCSNRISLVSVYLKFGIVKGGEVNDKILKVSRYRPLFTIILKL